MPLDPPNMLTPMEGSFMQPSVAQDTQAENIDAVLSRFQAWAGTRKTKEAAEGIRELSYEEALESSRYRWQTRPVTKEKMDAAPVVETSAPAAPNPRFATLEYPAFDDEAVAPDSVSLSNALPKSSSDTVAPAQNPPAPPVFGTILAETVSPEPYSGPLTLIWPGSSKSDRQVSMSLRVAASEQALIKARAAEAGLSASAYLRHCALEVEKLRAQVHHTLAVLERTSEQSSSHALTGGAAPVLAAHPGFFARLRRLILGAGPERLTLRV
jgi:hypothetical protein